MSTVVQRFAGYLSIVATEPGETLDEGAWAAAETELRANWNDLVEANGGEPLDPPAIIRVPNTRYGQPVTQNGYPVYGVDGQPLRDKLMGTVVGRALCARHLPETKR